MDRKDAAQDRKADDGRNNFEKFVEAPVARLPTLNSNCPGNEPTLGREADTNVTWLGKSSMTRTPVALDGGD